MSDDLLRKYVKPVDEPEPHEPSLVRGDGHLPRLEIREASGNSRSLPYSSLQYINFNPSVGVTLVFPDCVIELAGVNLFRLYDALNGHAVKTVLVIPDAFRLETPDATLVDACTVRTRKQGDGLDGLA